MTRSFTIVAALALGLACSRHLEEQVDAERACRGFCERDTTCGPASCAGGLAEEDCFDLCMDHEPHDWKGDCRFLQEDWYTCLGDLDCNEFHQTAACVNVPSEDEPCADEAREYALCLSEHR